MTNFDSASFRQRMPYLARSIYSHDTDRRSLVHQELHTYEREPLLALLDQLLDDEDENVRTDAAVIFAAVDLDRSLDRLLGFLRTPDAAMRWTICGLLSRHGDERAVEPLIQVLLSDDWPDTRMLAAFALGEIGDRRALEALRYVEQHDQGVDYENRTVRDAASEAISIILQKQ